MIGEELLRYLYINCQMSSVEIGKGLGISDRLVRSRLKLWGIETRPRGQFNRCDRGDVDPEELRRLYIEKEWPAASVGEELGMSGKIVLRSAHSGGSRCARADLTDRRRHLTSSSWMLSTKTLRCRGFSCITEFPSCAKPVLSGSDFHCPLS